MLSFFFAASKQAKMWMKIISWEEVCENSKKNSSRRSSSSTMMDTAKKLINELTHEFRDEEIGEGSVYSFRGVGGFYSGCT